MHFLIFLPGATQSTIEATCKRADLSDMLVGHDVMAQVAGPDNQYGCMIGWVTPQAPTMHYDKNQQDWVPSIQKIDGQPLYWIGFWKEKPPTESEIRKHYTQPGNRIKLGEQTWKMPTPDTVDSRAVYADDGSMRWETVRQFSWMCDEAKSITEQYLHEFGVRDMVFRTEPSAQINWLLKLLKVNYRITPEVAIHLDMWIGKEHIIDTFLSTLGLSRKVNPDD